MSSTEYIVRVHQEEDESYWAAVAELPGCFASGDTLDELSEALAESISLYLRDDDGHSGPAPEALPPPLRVGEMRVTVAA